MLKNLLCTLCLLAGAGCSDSTASPSPSPSDAQASADAPDAGRATGTTGATGDGGSSGDIRGKRYCEILLASVSGSEVHVDVYNTFGLNDCPDDLWSKVDASKVTAETGVSTAVLNGPRYWTLDAFEGSSFLDATPRTLGGIEMRLAGAIDVPLASAGTLGKSAYVTNTIKRNSTVRFDPGTSVFELVGPDGKVYDMQSYSVQKTPQSEGELATLGARLSLPAGWAFRTRTLVDALRITAVLGLATVVQDDLGNTYQLSNP